MIGAPLWALEALAGELGAVEAARLQQAAHAATVPHLKNEARRSLLRSLERATAPQGIVPRRRQEPIAHDPLAAAAYFAGLGVRVVTADEVA